MTISNKSWWLSAVAATAILTGPVRAADADSAEERDGLIIVVGAPDRSSAGTKTDTPLAQTPQALTIVPAEVYLAQGAISISDTLRYTAGVVANPYGQDSRTDGGFVRGLNPLQFRDGMRDIFSYYASIRGDPYNFSRVELVRGPASVLFGQGTLGGLINLVSKVPEFDTGGEVALSYGSFQRKEGFADLTGPLVEGLAGRIIARVRDADTRVDNVPDDRVMLAPSLRWRAGENTDITLLGLYQEDDSGSTSQFLPNVGTILPNPNGKLSNSTFIGKPGWDRYDGRLLQGTGSVEHSLSDRLKISLKARYIDSDLTYLTHYPDSYNSPPNPYFDAAQRTIGLYAEGSYARLNIFSTDNNIQFDFDTGAQIEHSLLAGIDYSWNRVRKTGSYAYETIDIYDIDYASLSDFGGGLPSAAYPGFLGGFSEDTRQKQLGFYVQDQIRFWDRVSLVIGARRDYTRTQAAGGVAEKDHATTFRAGLIAEIVKGVSPFLSYTESFEPISGTDIFLQPFKPKTGTQYEGGIKFHPDSKTLITLSAYHIREANRPVGTIIIDPSTNLPLNGEIQIGKLTSKGYEFEASRILPGNFELIAAYAYNKIRPQIDNVPKRTASLWATKTLPIQSDISLRLGGGVRHTSVNYSGTIRTPGYTLFDALAEVNWQDWSFAINATNLFNKKFYASCLSRGDCFIGEPRNIFATFKKRF
ncbi:TonB-dependent siderophore receptor [Sphingomonas sp. SRS2]|uniref:TonB-dependent siderophore receptor n=1 Tax=Sphingomonas sp. SRS2 TaxID=133190 RepID=UPI001F33EC31|nr:TonB-dependent receptor [Sphingomonas sp. SRS2]